MNVLLLTWDYPPARGGIQNWMFELAHRLPAADVTVFAPRAGGAARDPRSGPSVKRLRSAALGPGPWLLQLSSATAWRALTGRPDVIVCGHVLTAPAALLVRRVFGIPYVVFVYAYEIRRPRQQHIVRRVLRGADMVIACSHFTEAAVLRHGVAPHRVRLLYPGVDLARFGSAPTGTGERADTGTRTILSVGRLTEPYKGHDTVIRALPLIKARCASVRYIIVGDGPLREYLAALARSVGAEDAVVFAGEVPDEQLAGFYRACDVLVQLSRESVAGGGVEGFGIVCLEAAASGKPVVAGRSGGLVDAVVDGETGILVDPLDAGATADAILALLQDRALARRLGDAGRRRVRERFTWDRMATDARRLFAEAVGETWAGSAASSS